MATALRMTESQLLDLQARRGKTATAQQMRDNPAERVKRTQKYGNTKVREGDMVFDSKAEHKRWQYLVLLERAGKISRLQRQVPFELIPAMESSKGKHIRPTSYVADFTYSVCNTGEFIVEDVKGAVTPEFRLKRKLMLHVHNIEVQEIRS